jgi:adenylylsulfate kinase
MQQTDPPNIFPNTHELLSRSDKAALTGAHGTVIWLYGLSGSGKSTLANALERRLHADGLTTALLDGDNLRAGLTRNLGFSDEARRENIRIAAEVAKLFVQNAVTTICAFITPREELRQLARSIIGAEDFFEVFVDCTFETCEARDVKGLYAQARANGLQDFTGKQSAFERPAAADLLLNTEQASLEECLDALYRAVLPKLKRAG